MVDMRILSHLFRPSFLRKVGLNNHRSTLIEVLKVAGMANNFGSQATVSEVLTYAYEIMLKHYRCEYTFKNTILNKLFLSRHSFQNSYYTTEFICNTARADIVIANGTTTAYEIKTEYDSFDKLHNQLTEYHAVFDKVFIVTTKSLANKAVVNCLPNTGVLALDEKLVFKKIKPALSNSRNLSQQAIFSCLRQDEYPSALSVPKSDFLDMPNSMRYSFFKTIFLQLSQAEAHSVFLRQLRQRTPEKVKIPALLSLPHAIRQVWLEASGTNKELLSIVQNLNKVALST